jgi:hypothetical protein
MQPPRRYLKRREPRTKAIDLTSGWSNGRCFQLPRPQIQSMGASREIADCLKSARYNRCASRGCVIHRDQWFLLLAVLVFATAVPSIGVADAEPVPLKANAGKGLDGAIEEPEKVGLLSRATVSRFLAEYDQGESDSAWQLFSPQTQQMLPLPEWREKRVTYLRAAGQPLGHDIGRVLWLRNPPNATYPGLYAVFDVNCRYTLLQMCAEVVVLYSEKDGSPFTVMRHDQFSIETAAVRRLCLTNDTAQVDFGNGRMVQIKCPSKQQP